MTASSARVYVIDDDPSVLTSLGRLLRLEGFSVETFSSADEFLKVKKFHRPACVVSDVQMPGVNGLDLQNILVEKRIPIPMIFITGHGEIPMSVRAMKNGAVDFLPKPFGRDALLGAVKSAIEKDAASAELQHSVSRVRHRWDSLSDREKEVLDGVIAGMLNKQIAYKLGITEKTVKVHRANMMTKMKAESLAHLVRLAETIGIMLSVN